MSEQRTPIEDLAVLLFYPDRDGWEWSMRDCARGRGATDPEVLAPTALPRRSRPALSDRC